VLGCHGSAQKVGGSGMLVFGDPANPLPLALAVLLGLVLVILDLAMALRFMGDLLKPDRRVAGGDKTLWLIIIVFGSVLGWLAYILIGRQDER
jgi:hypothetical protein